MQETWVQSLVWEDTLEKGKATHSSILAWSIPWTCIVHGVTKSQTQLSDFHFQHFLLFWVFEESSEPNSQKNVCIHITWGFPGGARWVGGFPCGSAGKESACNAGDSGWIPGSGRSPAGRYGNALQFSCLENSTDSGAWRATFHGVAKSQTGLKRLSKHSTHYITHTPHTYVHYTLTTHTTHPPHTHALHLTHRKHTEARPDFKTRLCPFFGPLGFSGALAVPSLCAFRESPECWQQRATHI